MIKSAKELIKSMASNQLRHPEEDYNQKVRRAIASALVAVDFAIEMRDVEDLKTLRTIIKNYEI